MLLVIVCKHSEHLLYVYIVSFSIVTSLFTVDPSNLTTHILDELSKNLIKTSLI